jgi:hypothetical protein
METSILNTQILDALLRLGFKIAFPKIPSNQLKSALQIKYIDNTAGCLWIPHYWAVYLHSGRKASHGNIFLMWYINPAEDPRYRGGKYPVRREDVKRYAQLSKAEQIQIKQDIKDGKVIFAKRSPRSGDTVKHTPFFSNSDVRGMAGFRDLANIEGARIVNRYIVDRFERLGILNKTITATLQI